MAKSILVWSLICALALALSACGGDDSEGGEAAASPATAVEESEAVAAGDPAHGEELYMASCVACHGPDARGVQGLGKSLHAGDSDYVREHSDTELMEFLAVGRQPDHPLNTTGVAMPPKGGNPALTDTDMADIVAYLRTLE